MKEDACRRRTGRHTDTAENDANERGNLQEKYQPRCDDEKSVGIGTEMQEHFRQMKSDEGWESNWNSAPSLVCTVSSECFLVIAIHEQHKPDTAKTFQVSYIYRNTLQFVARRM
jgi:hypothetical protein